MNDKTKTRSEAATSERANEINANGQINDNYIYSRKITSSDIMQLLLEGKENAITAKEICDVLGISDTRTVTIEISRLRLAGAPICANTGSIYPGYYIAANSGELEIYLRSLAKRIKEIVAIYNALRSTHDFITGQCRIEEIFTD